MNFKGGDFLTSSERSVKSVVKRVREVSRENRRARESLSGTLRRTEAEQEWAAKRRNSRKRVGWDRPAFGSGSNRLRLLRLLAANAQVSVIRDGLPWLGNGSLGSLRVIREIGGETARRIFPAKPEGSRISKRYLATTGSRTGVAAKRRKSRKRAGGGYAGIWIGPKPACAFCASWRPMLKRRSFGMGYRCSGLAASAPIRVIREIGGETAWRIFPGKRQGSRISERYLATN